QQGQVGVRPAQVPQGSDAGGQVDLQGALRGLRHRRPGRQDQAHSAGSHGGQVRQGRVPGRGELSGTGTKTMASGAKAKSAKGKSAAPLVGVVMGSDSDWGVMQHAADVLASFGVPFEARVVSAHRTPDAMFAYA